MRDAIYLIKEEARERSVRMEPTPYATEDEFQSLLERFPELLAGEQIDRADPRRWLLIGREVGIADGAASAARWSLDHLFVDQDGILTLVEVKRQSDTRLRREVVGQVLEYAANAAKWWPQMYLQDQFARTCQKQGREPGEVLSGFLAGGTLSADAFWPMVEERLKKGDMRLVFFADVIPPELQSIVEFLNLQMSKTEVLAIEVQRYTGGGFSTHIPRLLGQSIAAQVAKESTRASSQRGRWTEELFFEEAEKSPAQVIGALRRLYSLLSDPSFTLQFGSGVSKGSINVYKPSVGGHALITAQTNGNLVLNFGSLNSGEPETQARERLGEFAENALGVKVGSEWRRQFPGVAATVWAHKVDELIAVLRALG